MSAAPAARGPRATPAVPGATPDRAAAAEVVRAVRRRGRARTARVALALAALVVLLAVVTACLGGFTVSLVDVVRIVGGAQIPGATFIVHEVRLPRLLTGIGAGAALGVSGAIFQTLVRNPLASPDIIGIPAGASAAAVVAITRFGTAPGLVAPVAVGGALAAAALIYALAWRGAVSGQRLILVGVGVAAVLNSVTGWAMTRAEITDASEALVWITGSLNGSTWNELPALWAPLVVLVAAAALLGRRLRALQLGDDAAAGLGVRTEPAKGWLVLVAVCLAAVAVAAAGPIAFVAFLSGPIARRLTGGGGLALGPAALVGAVIVLAADFAGAQVFGTRLPVGVITGVLGAPFLLWLLATANRVGRGG